MTWAVTLTWDMPKSVTVPTGDISGEIKSLEISETLAPESMIMSVKMPLTSPCVMKDSSSLS